MQKLKRDIVLHMNEDFRHLIEDEGLTFHKKITIEMYYVEDTYHDDTDWEVYLIKFIELEDDFDFLMNKDIMNVVRDIAERTDEDGAVENFIYDALMDNIKTEAEAEEARDFFEEISD